MQRLVQKEKQVLQLQGELDRLKAQNPADAREIVSDEMGGERQIFTTNKFRMTRQSESVIGSNGILSMRKLQISSRR